MSNTEQNYQRVVEDSTPTSWLPGTSIEVVRPLAPSQPPQHVLFDFDGTLSLIREGWIELMVPMMVEVLQRTGTDESPDQLNRLTHDFVSELTGKQTIYQMIRLAEEVEQRGGEACDPAVYKQEYHQRLMTHISSRRNDLRHSRVPREELLVPYSVQLLDELAAMDAQLYLASGTDENYVREEVALLGLDHYFGRHIYGAQDDYRSFSKAMVISRILEQNNVDGSQLLGFGDGYVEIQNVKEVGGIAVAVASDEKGRSGKVDLWKRDRLIGVGADLVIPDYCDHQRLVAHLWGQ